jgi:lipopolysaccharide/colanic/teichoic acid biosynthesis glycosyltransferase
MNRLVDTFPVGHSLSHGEAQHAFSVIHPKPETHLALAHNAQGVPSVHIDRSTGHIADLSATRAIRAALTEHRALYARSKRVFDVILALTLIVVLSPVWITAALLVRLTTDGSVLYKQMRVGQDGRAFRCLKFQTMVPNAHAMKMELVAFNEASGPVFKLKRDPRVTPIGRWLRKLSIDEMPQLINILRGEMSIVGPRPPLPDEVAHYTERHLGRLAVRPGLTCLWQVSGRSHIGFDEWVELDLEYIERRSFWYDLWLIALTVPAVLMARGAY